VVVVKLILVHEYRDFPSKIGYFDDSRRSIGAAFNVNLLPSRGV